ncbi:MAG: hypothetical protein IKF36_06965 [Bacilli bacterium]|nr:hypothetical protein [Bacilli bacterium]
MDRYYYSERPDLGFNIPFVIFYPKDESSKLVAANFMTPPVTNKSNLKDIFSELKEKSYPGGIFSENDTITIVPLIPRFNGYAMPYYTSMVYKNETELIKELDESEREKMKDIDVQLIKLFKYALDIIYKKGYDVDDKIILNGYSASSKFVTAFSCLHPEICRAVIAGGTTGLMIRPIKEINGVKLNFPLGINDVETDLEEFAKIPKFFYIGDEDNNDPALCKCKLDDKKDVNGNVLPKLDENGNIIPGLKDGKYQAYYKSLYTDEEIDIIYRYFGTFPLDRYENAKQIYSNNKINSSFNIYKGNHVTVTRDPHFISDLNNFIQKLNSKNKKRTY